MAVFATIEAANAGQESWPQIYAYYASEQAPREDDRPAKRPRTSPDDYREDEPPPSAHRPLFRSQPAACRGALNPEVAEFNKGATAARFLRRWARLRVCS